MKKEFMNIINAENTVYINRPLAHALGIKPALLYNALIGKQVYYEQHNMLDREGYFYSTIEDMQESTALSRCQQNKAIAVLIKAGLIDFRIGGVHRRRHFRVRDDVELLKKYLKEGAEKLQGTLQETDNIPCGKLTKCSAENLQGTLQETRTDIYKHNNQTKENNHNPSIISDGIDGIDLAERERYLEIIHENIEYDCIDEKEKADELVDVMLDVICSNKGTIRVNSDEVLHEVVKSRFLKLRNEHIEYVLLALKRNTSDVKDIRAYLITALYNAPTTKDSYYTALVSHDMYEQ